MSKFLDIRNLQEIDNYLLDRQPNIYEKSGGIVINDKYPFHYIKIWRRNPNINILSIRCFVFKCLCVLKKRFV